MVELLDERESDISMEAATALNKFATPKNYLPKAIIKDLSNDKSGSWVSCMALDQAHVTYLGCPAICVIMSVDVKEGVP